jgi:hypothetical protein
LASYALFRNFKFLTVVQIQLKFDMDMSKECTKSLSCHGSNDFWQNYAPRKNFHFPFIISLTVVHIHAKFKFFVIFRIFFFNFVLTENREQCRQWFIESIHVTPDLGLYWLQEWFQLPLADWGLNKITNHAHLLFICTI